MEGQLELLPYRRDKPPRNLAHRFFHAHRKKIGGFGWHTSGEYFADRRIETSDALHGCLKWAVSRAQIRRNSEFEILNAEVFPLGSDLANKKFTLEATSSDGQILPDETEHVCGGGQGVVYLQSRPPRKLSECGNLVGSAVSWHKIFCVSF